jgi:hypothetical protein
MTSRIFVLALVALALVACQSHATAMEIVCNAPIACDDCNAADPAMRAANIARYLSDHVTNAEAVQMFSALATMEPEDRMRIVRAEAAREGITSCPLADDIAR